MSNIDDFSISVIDLKKAKARSQVYQLLKEFDLKPDKVDYCIGAFDKSGNLLATASKYLNTAKCIAIKKAYQGQNITNLLITNIIKTIYQEGWQEVFIFTKPSLTTLFKYLGFTILFENTVIAFLTNRLDLFNKYLSYLKNEAKKYDCSNAGAIVVNANPFTNGHLALIKKASQSSSVVFIIVVKEDALFSYEQRLKMVKLGVKEFKNVLVLHGSNYIVSKSIFPSYFIPSPKLVIKEQTTLDANIFAKYMAPCLKINRRFVGDEPYSKTTADYNKTLKYELQQYGINLEIIKRARYLGNYISATTVRELFMKGKFKDLAAIVPKSTLEFLSNLDYKNYKNYQNIENLVFKTH